MTINEKAQRYDEALKVAKDIRNGEATYIPNGTPVIEAIFPELKESEESEDERIRQDIIWCFKHSGIKDSKPINPHVTTITKDAIAWLEKQGMSYTKKDVDDAYLKGVADTKNEIEKQYDATYQIRKDIATFILNYKGDIKDRAKWIDYLGIKVSFVENQSEHKPVNVVEFHEGDWVVYNHDICQIVKREEGCNKLVTVFGIEKELVNERNLSTARLWTIQDAKDDDVLCTYECCKPKIVFILKGIPKKHYALSYHCYYNIMYPHFEADSKKGCLAPNDEDVKPATKEQRDLLFQKMKEAGYEWNVEKKELKKIESYSLRSIIKDEPSPAIKKVVDSLTAWNKEDEKIEQAHDVKTQKSVEWEPQTGDTFRKKGTTSPTYHLCGKQEDGITFGFVENREVGIAGGAITIFALKSDYELVERLKPIEDVVEEELNKALQTKVEQNPAWSEEDEKIYQSIMDDTVQENQLDDRQTSWLKSLKDRVQPKQEWSEKDKVILGKCLEAVSGYYSPEYKQSMKDWLNSLKNRYTWKPSEEMLEALYRAIPENVMAISEDEMLLDKLYQGLKYGKVLSEK